MRWRLLNQWNVTHLGIIEFMQGRTYKSVFVHNKNIPTWNMNIIFAYYCINNPVYDKHETKFQFLLILSIS